MTEPNERTHLLDNSTSRGKAIDSANNDLEAVKHCHVPDREIGIDKVARKKLIIASLLCLVFMIGEGIGGWLANSLAIATDAAHLLADFAAFMISLLAIWLSGRPASKKYTFGWYRAEVVGALTSVALIWVITGILVYMAIERLRTGQFDLNAKIMLITSGMGVLVNIIMGMSLYYGVPHGHSHGGGGEHGHAHSHEDGHSHGGEGNINVRAALIHVIGDLIQSVGVFIAALVIFFKPEWAMIDPICTFIFSVLVLFTTYKIMRDVMRVFMEGTPNNIDYAAVQQVLLALPNVVRVHNLHLWSLSMDKIALSSHIAITRGADVKKTLALATQELRAKFDIFELTLQVEEYNDKIEDCNQCASL